MTPRSAAYFSRSVSPAACPTTEQTRARRNIGDLLESRFQGRGQHLHYTLSAVPDFASAAAAACHVLYLSP